MMLARHRGGMHAATQAPPNLRASRGTVQSPDPRSIHRLRAAGKTWQGTVLLLGTVLLGVLGGAALFLAVAIEVPETARADAGAENEEIVRRFYAAVNDAVRTGDLSLLDHVAVTKKDHMPGAAGIECDVRCRASALHRLDPDVRLQVDDMLVDRDRIVARLSVQTNNRPAFLGLALQGALAPWAPVDFLRVADGQIVEVQPAGDLPTLVEPLARTALETVPAAPYRLGLVRLTLEPSAALPALSAGGPMFLFVESGTLVVHVDQPSRVQRAGRTDDPGQEELLAAGAITLSPGEGIALGADTGYTLRSIGNEAAVVLSAATLAGDGGPTNRWGRARTLDEILFNPGESDVVAQTSAPTPWPPGVQSELIADGIIRSRPTESASIGLTRLTLTSNAALPVHDISGAELLVVETGSAIIDLVNGDGAVRPKMGASLARTPLRGGRSAHGTAVSIRGSAVLQPGASAGVRNVADESLVLLILTVEPGSDVR